MSWYDHCCLCGDSTNGVPRIDDIPVCKEHYDSYKESENKPYKTREAQKKSKQVCKIELSYYDTLNLRRILYLSGKHLNLNSDLLITWYKLRFATKELVDKEK